MPGKIPKKFIDDLLSRILTMGLSYQAAWRLYES